MGFVAFLGFVQDLDCKIPDARVMPDVGDEVAYYINDFGGKAFDLEEEVGFDQIQRGNTKSYRVGGPDGACQKELVLWGCKII